MTFLFMLFVLILLGPTIWIGGWLFIWFVDLVVWLDNKRVGKCEKK